MKYVKNLNDKNLEADFLIVLNYINENLIYLNFNNEHIPNDVLMCSLKVLKQNSISEIDLPSNLELITEIIRMNNLKHKQDVYFNIQVNKVLLNLSSLLDKHWDKVGNRA